jgi:hypothetical protein
LGEFYLVNWRINGIADKDLNLEATGREPTSSDLSTEDRRDRGL